MLAKGKSCQTSIPCRSQSAIQLPAPVAPHARESKHVHAGLGGELEQAAPARSLPIGRLEVRHQRRASAEDRHTVHDQTPLSSPGAPSSERKPIAPHSRVATLSVLSLQLEACVVENRAARACAATRARPPGSASAPSEHVTRLLVFRGRARAHARSDGPSTRSRARLAGTSRFLALAARARPCPFRYPPVVLSRSSSTATLSPPLERH